MNKQGIVKLIGLSSLSFSLVSGIAIAQGQLPSQLVNNTNGANMVEENVNTVAVSDLQSQPVAVTSSMSPVQAPLAETSSGLSVGQGGVSLSSAPSTGIGGSNPGNANTGGLQVQNVTVQASPEVKATNMASINSDYARAELLRQRRVRSEVDNETRLLEKLEEGRLADERAREGNIEGYYSSVAGLNSATATAIGANPTAVAVATQNTQLETVPVVATGISTEVVANSSVMGMSSFALTPFAGYRWFDNGGNFYRAENRITTGLSLEGKFNRHLSFEGAFTYGYDKFYEQINQVNPYIYSPQQYAVIVATRSRDTFEASAGLKAAFDASSKLRPYVAGSLGGMLSMYNIDDQVTKDTLKMSGLMRSTVQFIGNIGGGLDYSIARNFTMGARFDYQGSFENNTYDSMDQIWGDQASRYRLTGSLQLVF